MCPSTFLHWKEALGQRKQSLLAPLSAWRNHLAATLPAGNLNRRHTPSFFLLTITRSSIKLSVFVDNNELITSGRGTGPMTPRQPAPNAFRSVQVPNPAQAQMRSEKR